MSRREFPIQTERGAAAHPLRIPWSVAEKAYSVYAGMYGRGQSLERIAERGGFGPSEMDSFLPGWRDECDQLARIREKLQRIVCTGGCDAGVVLLSQDGPTHAEVRDGKTIQVYDHDYFSPLGDALIELYELAGGKVEE